MKYAALIVSKPSNNTKMRHTVIAHLDSEVRVWSRLSDGRQGLGSRWSSTTLTDVLDTVTNDTTYGQPVAVPVTDKDVQNITATGASPALFARLLRYVPTEPSDLDIRETLHTVFTASPEVLAQYHVDGRTTRSTSTDNTVTVPAMGFVPTFEEVGHYIPRSWHGVDELSLYTFARANRMNMLFEGPAGSGKTTSAMWYAMLCGLRYISMQCSLELVASTLWGMQKQNPKTGRWEWHDGEVTDVVRNGGVLVIDEITSADPRTLMNLNSLLDDRRMLVLPENDGEIVKAHDDLIIVAAYNPNYRGTRPMNEALRDRFDIKVTYDYSTDIEKQIVKSESLLDLAKRMRKASNPTFATQVIAGDVAFETPISPRLLKAFEKIATGLSYDFAVDVFINNFSEEERSSVRMLLDGMKYNLQSDLGLIEATTETEEVENEFDPTTV